MTSQKKCILLNTGTKTRHALMRGLGNMPNTQYKTKFMMLHIKEAGMPIFIYKNTPIEWNTSCVFTRLRSNDQHFCGMLYDYFAHHNIPVNDPINHSYVHSAEKISQMLLLALAGIRIPETFIFREESFAKNKSYLEAHLTFPLVYKTDGSKGRNVHFVETMIDLEMLVANKKAHELALMQPFIENTFDTRTLVAYGEILGSIKRARTSGYLNNIAQGAVASSFALSDNERDVALRATEACKIDFAGVDLIHTDRGPIVLEVNKSPQVGGFESVHNFSVFEKIGNILAKKYDA